MIGKRCGLLSFCVMFLLTFSAFAQEQKLRILCFGAHPDDCELRAAGVAVKWTQQGHQVKFVSVTNGDIGHWREAGAPLARRRTAEVQAAAEILGIETQVLDIHDGELEPTLENRRTITRLIREWKADIVMAHRPNDYHPDHRYTGILVQDAAYMVTVPGFCPDVPALEHNPVFMYFTDNFQKPNPFLPDIVVPIDDVIETKSKALACLESQFYEGGANGGPHLIPADAEGEQKRRREVQEMLLSRDRRLAQGQAEKGKLAELLGERAEKVQYVESFEVCEYGRRPTPDELKQLFPFFDEQ